MDRVELVGINRDANRIPLFLLESGQRYGFGYVRNPSNLSSLPAEYNIVVNQDEVETQAKRILEQRSVSKQAVQFEVDGTLLFGTVNLVTEGLGAGAFDGINIPDQRTLMVKVTSIACATDTVSLRHSGDKVQDMVLQMMAHKHWQQPFVRNGEAAEARKQLASESGEYLGTYALEANWSERSGGTNLSIQVMAMEAPGQQAECNRMLREILDPIVQNRFNPPY